MHIPLTPNSSPAIGQTIQRLRDQSNDRPDQLRLANEIITTAVGKIFFFLIHGKIITSHYSGQWESIRLFVGRKFHQARLYMHLYINSLMRTGGEIGKNIQLGTPSEFL